MSSRQPKVILIGDTSLKSNHFGCQLVCQTFREQFSRVGLHLTASLPYDYLSINDIHTYLNSADLIVINGEGSIHGNRYENIIELSSRYPTALVNTVYQNNKPYKGLNDLLYISARESLSAQEIMSHGANCSVVPDLLFASSLLNSYIPNTKPFRAHGTTDNAKKLTKRIGLFSVRYRRGNSPKQAITADYLKYLCEHKTLTIGRFHAAIAASVLGIPFSTWDSNTWKLKGLMRDMGVSHLHFTSREAAILATPKNVDPKITQFSKEAKYKIEEMFDNLVLIVNNSSNS